MSSRISEYKNRDFRFLFLQVRALTSKHGIKIMLDMTRAVENAWFIKSREAGYQKKTVKEILLEFCSLSGIFLIYFQCINIFSVFGYFLVSVQIPYCLYFHTFFISILFSDGGTMSGKKDALVNIGGWLSVNDKELFDLAGNMCVVYEGLHTYGGMAGRDMEAMARGIRESVQVNNINITVINVLLCNL